MRFKICKCKIYNIRVSVTAKLIHFKFLVSVSLELTIMLHDSACLGTPVSHANQDVPPWPFAIYIPAVEDL